MLINLWSSPISDKTPLGRANFLESRPLCNIHAAAAAGGQTAVPADLDTDLHFTCFVQAPEASAREVEIATGERRLIELDWPPSGACRSRRVDGPAEGAYYRLAGPFFKN